MGKREAWIGPAQRERGDSMFCTIRVKKAGVFLIPLLLAAAIGLGATVMGLAAEEAEGKDFIRWVDFDVPTGLLQKALEIDLSTNEAGRTHLGWVDLLACLAAEHGGDFSHCGPEDLDSLAEKAAQESIEKLGGRYKSFSYYQEAYGAVLGGFVGEFQSGGAFCYGLKAYSPIAQTFPYNDYDDFGVSRSYGYQRRHLGHDMMAAVGTPVIAVESGTVEALGWNQYGGWRIGIRSFDGLRYHYYAHLRKDRPFAAGLRAGQVVMAGDVIGYVGRTGYSAAENVNGIEESHLHYGLQIIFDESQKEGNGEIWVDVYSLCSLLRTHQAPVARDDATKEWARTDTFQEDVPEGRFIPSPSPPAA